MDTLTIKIDSSKTKALIEMFKAFDIAYELNVDEHTANNHVLYAEEATNLSPKQIKAIDEALDDVANGRLHTHEEAMKILKSKHPKYF